MSRCPFAQWDEINGPVGAYVGGPFKIVHHTTELSSYEAAKAAYKAHKSEPHFTVAGSTVFQHVDTAMSARALKNRPGGVQTNRDSAVQIEVMGFAGRAKDPVTLQTTARLCRWIEGEHSVPQHWPNGPTRWSINGRDPGGHNRNAAHWDSASGHFGHSQVPENDHWDPGYTPAELTLVTPDAVPDAHESLNVAPPQPPAVEVADLATTPSAENVAVRVVAAVTAQLPATLSANGATIAVRVVAGGTDVSVTIDMLPRRTKPRAARSRGTSAKRRRRKPGR